MTDDRDAALAELEAAGVIAPAGFNDANGNAAYRFCKFPPGAEGEWLRALFDRFVTKAPLDDSSSSR